MAKEWVIKKRQAVGPLVPDYERDVHDPFLMQDMKKAVTRILKAVEKDERVMIFADYDADGVPGAAILSIFFNKIGFTNFSIYLPDRHLEDYGLSGVAIDQAKADGVTLLITIDCGIANAKEVTYAKKLKIETIVTDHHLVPAEMPKAVAVLDPKREDCNYPFKELCGAGVVYKLVQALASQLQLRSPKDFLGSSEAIPRTLENLPTTLLLVGWEKWLLDLVAIATVSDMVPLVGENRALVHFGLKVLRKSPRPGVVELCRALRIKQEKLMEDDIAFSIGPRINAASRMAHAREAFELLTTEDAAVAATIANRLEKLNKERRKCVDEILLVTTREFSNGLGIFSEDLSKTSGYQKSPLVVIGHESWSLGVLGLTASRLVEKYRCPVFIWGKNGNGVIKGSCRSDGSINVVELMRGVGEDFFLNIGGHHHAGGFSLHQDRLPELESRLLTAFATLDKKILEEELEIDREIELEQVTSNFYQELYKLSPFGIGNPKPLFLFSKIKIIEMRAFGNGEAHLELVLPNKLKAISFFNTFPDLDLQAGQTINLAASIEQSFFRSNGELRLRIVDLKRVFI
jgi:single-stranded-DNA-specific exonuclease